MRVFVLLSCCAVIALLVGAPSGVMLSREECGHVSGGQGACDVDEGDKAPCGQAKVGTAKCSDCQAGHIECVAATVSEHCETVYNTAPEDCISCGTCQNRCGGTARYYLGTPEDCDTSTWTTESCTQQWTDAQNGDCAVACDPPPS